MTKKQSKTLSAALGAAFLASSTMAASALSAENPFQINQLSSGYQLADSHEGKCGEGKCGDDKSEKEGKCGEEKAEGEGTCGGEKSEDEGKCGEGKCGDKG